jgi:hypothetical protein
MGIDQSRQVAMFDFLRRGWSQQTAGQACFALHPLDDTGTRCAFADGSTGTAPVPPRAFAKAVRKRSRAFAKSIKRADEDQATQLAEDAWVDYRQMATGIGVDYYIKRFEQLATPEPGTAGG